MAVKGSVSNSLSSELCLKLYIYVLSFIYVTISIYIKEISVHTNASDSN